MSFASKTDGGGRTRSISLIGASLDLGAGRRGVDMGPSAVRYAGLEQHLERLGYVSRDLGNVVGPVAEASHEGSEHVRYLEEIKAVCAEVSELVSAVELDGSMPLVLGGDHSIALGTLTGLARERGRGGVLWIDAHGDLNRPATSPTGNVHGMALAAAAGLGGEEFDSPAWELPAVDPARIAIIGARSLDDGERALVRERGIAVHTMSDVDRHGVERVVQDSLERVAGPGFVHVSLDMDALDPEIAPGVGTPVRGGFSYREAHLALELIAESELACSLEVVEINPILDVENKTARLAVELIASALGARIL